MADERQNLATAKAANLDIDYIDTTAPLLSQSEIEVHVGKYRPAVPRTPKRDSEGKPRPGPKPASADKSASVGKRKPGRPPKRDREGTDVGVPSAENVPVRSSMRSKPAEVPSPSGAWRREGDDDSTVAAAEGLAALAAGPPRKRLKAAEPATPVGVKLGRRTLSSMTREELVQYIDTI